MPKFTVCNRLTRMVLGEVEVDDPADVLDQLCVQTGSSIEDIALSLGKTVEQAKAALDIIQTEEAAPVLRGPSRPGKRVAKATLAPRRLFQRAS